jgi:uncharacterized membrane protein
MLNSDQARDAVGIESSSQEPNEVSAHSQYRASPLQDAQSPRTLKAGRVVPPSNDIRHLGRTLRRRAGALLLAFTGAVSVSCASDDSEPPTSGGAGAAEAGASTATGGSAEVAGALDGGGAAGEGGADASSGASGSAASCSASIGIKCASFEASTQGAAGASAVVIPAVAELESEVKLSGLNNHDQIVGSRECAGTLHAFMSDHGEFVDLLADLGDVTSYASDINDAGVVIGAVAFEWNEYSPFIWKRGVTTVLRDLRGMAAVAINDHDQVLIAGENALAASLLWENGVLTEVGSNLEVRDLNNQGQVVGMLFKSPGTTVGFVWENGVTTELPQLQSANAINDSGQIAGGAPQGGPVILDGDRLIELGPPGIAWPIAIAADGAVLGSDYIFADGVMAKLSGQVGDKIFRLWMASDMNDSHLSVGQGDVLTFNHQGSCRNESCEQWTSYAVVWTDACFASCCAPSS